MATIMRFEDIEAWKKGRELRKAVYAHTRKGDFAKDFALRDQIRRAAISITSNIAEGFDREGNREFLQFLSNAKGSCGEVRDQLYAALDEGYIVQAEFEALYNQSHEVSRLISGFMKYLRTTSIRGHKYLQGPKG